MDIVVYLLCYCLDIKDKPRASLFSNIYSASDKELEQHGLCRAISYIIQTLSAESAFGLQLTFPVKAAHLPAKWNVGGAAADFMINVSFGVILAGTCLSFTTTRPFSTSQQRLPEH